MAYAGYAPATGVSRMSTDWSAPALALYESGSQMGGTGFGGGGVGDSESSMGRGTRLTRRCCHRCCGMPWWRTVATVVAVLGAAFGGGLLNRIRGGWTELPQFPSDDNFSHDLVARLVFGLPTGAILLVFGAGRKRLVVPALVTAVWTTLSLFVGWGTYMAIGRNPMAYTSRAGVFDWLIGAPAQDWDYTRRWVRDMTGMSLRGCLQTTVPGFVLYLYGYGSLYAFWGIAMGTIYELGWDIPFNPSSLPNFVQGTPLAEFLWVRCWVWGVGAEGDTIDC